MVRVLASTLKTLKLWQIGVLVTVLAGAAAATYSAYTLVSGSGQAGLADNQQLIPVQRGNLVNQVSTNGSIIFPNRETLTFDSQGTVGDVLVEEGQQVVEGQGLVTMDQTTIASLERAVAQARINLRNAEDALAKARDPHTPLDMAVASANVANAKLSLGNAQNSLDELLEPTDLEVAQAEAVVVNARLSLQSAQDDLADLTQPPQEELAKAEAAVTDAKISAANTLEALVTAKGGATTEEIAKAQSQIDSAAATLANAEGDRSLTQKEWDVKVETAQESNGTALEEYQSVFWKWMRIGPEEVGGDLAPDSLLDSWEADLDTLFDPSVRYQDSSLGFVAEGPPPDNPDTPWSEVVVYAWSNLTPSALVPTCEDGEIDSQTLCVKEEIDDAWDSLLAAADNLDTVETQAAKALVNAELTVTREEEGLVSAQETLAELEAEPAPLQIESLEKQYSLALATFRKAEETLAELQTGSDSLEVEAKRKQVAVARANLDEAEQELELLEGPDVLEVEAQRLLIAVTQANLDQADEELAELKSSVDPLEVALGEADVASAQLALDTAIEQLEGMTLMSPMNGVVSRVNVDPGQTVNTNTPIIEVVDTTVVEVDGIVDEIDVLFVRVGARAEVTMDALPGQVLEGTVSAIASAAQNQQGVVTYPISIQVQVPVPEGVQLVEGLSATASIVIREDTDVLLVPTQAIYGTFDQPVVLVMSDGSLQEQPVTLSNSDGFWIVVIEGLQEGDLVAIETTETSTDPFAQFRQQIQGGGGRGGAGGGGFGSGRGGGFGGGGRP